MCVLTECVTQRSPGLLVTKLCQVSPSLNVANVHLVLLGTQAEVEGAQLPGGQLAHFWGQRHEGHIPTGTSVSAATQNTLFQMDDLCHQQHEIIPGGIGLRSRNNKTTINYSDVNVTVLIDRKPTFIICQSSARF